MIQEIIERIVRIEHGFKPIEREAKALFVGNTRHDALMVANAFFARKEYQARALAVFVFGYIASTDTHVLQMLKTTVSRDPSWQVQEILAKSFDQYCKDVGYENALPVVQEWLSDDHPNVCRAVTEGLRIWTSRPYFKTHPEAAIQLISQHKAHESDYLRKSVGNALRDISKKHKDLVEKEVSQWDLSNQRILFTYKLTVKAKR
jgi:3-methyladenine DNA glycosylase AlkD